MELLEICKRAKEASRKLGTLDTNTKNRALLAAAELLVSEKDAILAANEKDLERGRKNHMQKALLDRLMLNEARIAQMAEGLRQVAGLSDPVGEVLSMKTQPNGLRIGKKRVPLGVVGMIYEARPNVTADAFVLCFKTGNAVILKGGSDALCSNTALVALLRRALLGEGVPCDAVSLIEDTSRETTAEFMRMNEYVDVLIPRGGAVSRELLLEATEDDWGTEYLDYRISVKTVGSLDEAISHINRYNTGHSEAIITESYRNAERFLNEVDAACVYVNASTRFSDGFEFGFGAEIGISTQKLHARGPMGLEALTSTKYVIYGDGQVRA